MQKLGLFANEGYICFGVGHVGMQEFLTHRMARFDQLIYQTHDIPLENFSTKILETRKMWLKLRERAKLEALEEMNSIFKIEENTKLNKEQEEYLSKKIRKKLTKKIKNLGSQNQLFDIAAFLEEVELLQHIYLYPHLFQKDKKPFYQEAESAFEILQPEQLINEGGLSKVTTFSGSYNKKELKNYFVTLHNAAKKADCRISFMLSNFKHTIHVGYDPKEKKWVFIDSEELPSEYIEATDFNKITKLVRNAFTNNNRAIFATEVYVTKRNEKKAIPIIANWQQNPIWREMQQSDKPFSLDKITEADSDGYTWLPVAIKARQFELAKRLLHSRSRVNQTDYLGATPLFAAIETGNVEFVKLLLQEGANPIKKKHDGATPIFIAAECGFLEIVQLLLNFSEKVNPNEACNTKDDNRTPLFAAAECGHLNVVLLLLQHGAQVNYQAYGGYTPLYTAAINGYLDIAHVLLNHGADINMESDKGSSPLFAAAQNGHLSVVKLLLARGADRLKIHSNGATPLFIAAQNGHAEVVAELLLNSTKDINHPMTANKNFLMDVAKKLGRDKQLEVLLKHKNPNKDIGSSIHEFTSLHAAVFFGHANVVKILIEAGANIEKQAMGISPLELARVMKREEIVKILENTPNSSLQINTLARNG